MDTSIRAQMLAAYKENFCDLLRETGREHIEELIRWLEETDFFTAPASAKTHGAYEGGLLIHSLSVYKILLNFSKNIPNVKKDSIILSALLHDLCKAGFYKTELRNRKNDHGEWEKVPVYAVDDQFPYGHGEKSVYLIERFLRLKTEEAMAVRWHMGGFDDSVRGGSFALAHAFEKYPLAVKLHLADLEATYLREHGTSEVRN